MSWLSEALAREGLRGRTGGLESMVGRWKRPDGASVSMTLTLALLRRRRLRGNPQNSNDLRWLLPRRNR